MTACVPTASSTARWSAASWCVPHCRIVSKGSRAGWCLAWQTWQCCRRHLLDLSLCWAAARPPPNTSAPTLLQMRNPAGDSKGYAFVEFTLPSAAAACKEAWNKAGEAQRPQAQRDAAGGGAGSLYAAGLYMWHSLTPAFSVLPCCAWPRGHRSCLLLAPPDMAACSRPPLLPLHCRQPQLTSV